jgi:hypothetical protein
MFWHKLFECDEVGDLQSSQSRDIEESIVREEIEDRYMKLVYPRK